MLIDERIALAHTAVKREEWDQAWSIVRDALNEDPENPAGLYLLALCMRAQNHTAGAMVVLRRVLAIAPKKVNVWMHYGACLHDLSRFDEAREAFLMVHKELPDDPMPMANIAAGYTQLGRASLAIEWADKALKLDPECRIARIAKGFSCLSIGRWSDGWEHLSELYGDTLVTRIYNPPGNEEPEWDGTHGKTVVVQCDQGVGDQIMFSQCIPDLQAVSRKVIIECSERMVPLFKRNFPGVEVHGTLKHKNVNWAVKAGIDAHIHISGLGKWFRKRDSDFTRRAYLKPDPVLVSKWKEWLAKFPKPWVGIAWRGGLPQTGKADRSIELNDYAPLISRGTFFDLSYDDSGLEVSQWNIENDVQIKTPPIDRSNFDDTIALVAALDDVVTVTTTLAHVCGAIGRHAYVLVPAVPQWRYAYRADDGLGLVWYPSSSIRLYRRDHGEKTFENAIKRVAKDMNAIRSLRVA